MFRDAQTGWLLPAEGWISQGFGATDEPRDSGTLYLGRRYAHFNKGIDVACPSGTPIFAVAAGVVRVAGPSNTGWDTVVWVEDAYGVTHNYGHLSAPLVALGEEVDRGQEIARSGVGDPRHSTGAHLSYDAFRRTAAGGMEWVDPTLYLEPAGAVVPGLAATVVNNQGPGANLRTAPDLSAPVLDIAPNGTQVWLRRGARYPMLWSIGGQTLWSGLFSLDPPAVPAGAVPGAPIPSPAATVSTVTGSRLLGVDGSGAFAVAGPAPAGLGMSLPLPEWYPVRWGERCGWIHSSLLTFTAVATAPPEVEDELVPGVVMTVTDDGVRLRAAPSFGENVLGLAQKGTPVRLRTDAYYPVHWNDADGWVWGEFLTFAAQAGAPPGLRATVRAGSTPNLRAEPFEQAGLLGQVPSGAHVPLRAKAFFPVWWDGVDGWMWGELLSSGAAGPAALPVLSEQADAVLGFHACLPWIESFAARYGADAQVLAGIVAQESDFVNVRVHHDGTGHGLIGLDDNGLLPFFEQWSGLSVGRDGHARSIPPALQLEYLARTIAALAQAHGGNFLIAARQWHTGAFGIWGVHGDNYEVLIRGHIARLFP